MGKSNKKIKSERINALKKQYDAFLEEDKKRKERNEYILNRLDTMRSCNALVSLYHASNSLQPTIYNTKYAQVNAMGCNERARSDPTLDEAMLLKEISKKFILIPKLRSTLDNECNQAIKSIVNDSTDWKSKYDILDQLKQKDKDSGFDLKLQRDKPTLQTDEEQSNIHLIENKNDPPVRDIADNRLQFQISNQNEECDENKTKSIVTTLNSESAKPEIFNMMPDTVNNEAFEISENNSAPKENRPDIHEKHELELQSKHETKNTNDDETVDHAQVTNEDYLMKVTEEQPGEPTPYEQFMSTEADENTNPENANYNFDENNTHFEQVMKHNECLEEKYNNDMPQPIESTEYLIESVQEFTHNDNIQIQGNADIESKENKNDQINTTISHEYESEPQLVAENNEYPVDVSQIEAFDAEQREMFYTEETDKNYDEYNQEHTSNAEYATNNEYQQNEEYAYYEGTQAEQSFPDEINEHEETSQRYDQSYEQQYTNLSEEQQHQQKSFNPQLHQYEGYDQTQGQFDQEQYEQQNDDTQQYVEHELNNEEGYNEIKNEEIEDSKTQLNQEKQNIEPIIS